MAAYRGLEILEGQLDSPPGLSSPLVNSTVYQMEQIGASYPFAHQDPNKMARLAESIHALFEFLGIRVPFDLCVETEAFSCEIKMGGQPAFPYITKSLQAQLEPFPLPKNHFEQRRFPVVFRYLNCLQKKIQQSHFSVGGLNGTVSFCPSINDLTKLSRAELICIHAGDTNSLLNLIQHTRRESTGHAASP